MTRASWNTVLIIIRKLAPMMSLVSMVALQSHSEPPAKTPAPTFYIVASGQYSEYSKSLTVRGASNLPAGSRIDVSLSDFIGFQSSYLSDTETVTLDKTGLFKVTLRPLKGKRLKDNMVCDLSFVPRSQSVAIRKVVGTEGELLGIDSNPQVGKNSGGYYLQALVHIP